MHEKKPTVSKGITEGYACSFIHQLWVGLNCLDTDSNLILEEWSIFLCAIPIWKKINYNKQKGYKNMISDMTCLHFSWMTLLLVKKRSWVISLSTELMTLIHFKLWCKGMELWVSPSASLPGKCWGFDEDYNDSKFADAIYSIIKSNIPSIAINLSRFSEKAWVV